MFALTVLVVVALALGALVFVALSPRLEDRPAPLSAVAGARIEYQQDFTGSLSLSDVIAGAAAQRFQPLTDAPNDPALRRLPGWRVNWLRLVVPNAEDEPRPVVLQLARRDAGRVDVFLAPSESANRSVDPMARTGLLVPFADRSLRTHLPAFGLTLPPQSTTILFVRNAGELDTPAPVAFWRSFEEFRRHERRELIAVAVFVGLVGMLLLHHAMAAAILRDTPRWLFCGYLVTVLALAAFATNATTWFVDGPAGIARMATLLGLAAAAGLARVHFTRALLDTRRTARGWDSLLRAMSWVFLAAMVSAPALLLMPEALPLAMRVVPAVVLVVIVLLPLAAMYAGVQGSAAAPLAAVASTTLAVGAGWVVLSHFGLAPPEPTGGAPLFIGLALELLLLGGALVLRQRALRAERDELHASHATRLERETADAKGDLLGIAHQLAQSKKDKDRLIALIAQEIRAPLGSLVAVSRSLPADRAAEQLPVIRRRCSALIELLNTVIDWAKLRTNQFAHDPGRCALATLVDTALRPLEPSAHDKGVRLDRRIPTSLAVRADSPALGCVLRHLVGNALKFSAPGGTIGIEASAAANMIELRVQDSGVGMTPEQLAQLEPAASAEEITIIPGTAGETGVGLGLAVARELLERDGGTLRFESTLGRGTVAIVTLPAEAAPPRTGMDAPARKPVVAVR